MNFSWKLVLLFDIYRREAEFEKKINDIYELLHRDRDTSSQSTSEHQHDIQRLVPCMANTSNINALPSTFPAKGLDIIESGFLSTTDTLDLLQVYRTCSSVFPFVPLPTEIDLLSLRKNRPVFLLAALTIAAYRTPKRQRIMDRSFREFICTKAILEGQTSLDLLQGLLVYLAWYGCRELSTCG